MSVLTMNSLTLRVTFALLWAAQTYWTCLYHGVCIVYIQNLCEVLAVMALPVLILIFFCI